MNATHGAVIWTRTIPYIQVFTKTAEILGSPSVANGIVFASSNVISYYAINESTSEILWNFTDPDAGEFIYNAPIYENRQIILIDKFNIACLNASTGKILWSFYTGDELYVGPTYADGKIYDVTSQRHIFVQDANNNGSKLQTIDMPSSSWSSPIIANNMLYVGCNDWNLYAFRENVTNQNSSSTSKISLLAPSSLVLLGVAIIAVVAVVILVYAIRKKRSNLICSKTTTSCIRILQLFHVRAFLLRMIILNISH